MALLNRVKKYCGKNPQAPEGYDRLGTRYECLRAGIYVGKKASEAAINDARLESQRQQKEHI